MFHHSLTCFRVFQPVESLIIAMEKIIMKWTEGISKGATSVVKRSAIKISCPDKFYSYNDNLNDPCDFILNPSALLHTKFAFWFLPFSTRIRTKNSRPPVQKIYVRPHNYSPARNNNRTLWKKLWLRVMYRMYKSVVISW